jgi:hypothetical protein
MLHSYFEVLCQKFLKLRVKGHHLKVPCIAYSLLYTSCKIIVFFYMLLDSLLFTLSCSVVQGSLMASHRSFGSFYSVQQLTIGITVESISVR